MQQNRMEESMNKLNQCAAEESKSKEWPDLIKHRSGGHQHQHHILTQLNSTVDIINALPQLSNLHKDSHIIRPLIMSMLDAITFVTRCPHNDGGKIINIVQLSTLPGVKITLTDLLLALLIIATNKCKTRPVIQPGTCIIPILYDQDLLNHIAGMIVDDVDDDNDCNMTKVIDHYAALMIGSINQLPYHNQLNERYPEMLSKYQHISSSLGNARLEDRMNKWFLVDGGNRNHTKYAKLIYLTMIQDKPHSKLLNNNEHKQVVFDFIITINSNSVSWTGYLPPSNMISDVLDIVMRGLEDDQQQQQRVIECLEKDTHPFTLFQILMCHIKPIEPYFNKYINSLPDQYANTLIKLMGPSFLNFNFDFQKLRSMILLDGITSCYKEAGKPLPYQLINNRNIFFTIDLDKIYIPYVEKQEQDHLIARGLITAYEITNNINHLYQGLVFLLYRTAQDDQTLTLNDIVINKYSSELKAVIGDPIETWIQYIDIMMDGRQTYPPRPHVTINGTKLQDQLIHVGHLTRPVFHFLKYAYLMQTLGFNFKRCKLLLLSTLDHRADEQLINDQRQLFKEFKRNQLLITPSSRSRSRSPSQSLFTLPLIVVNKIVQDCILGCGDELDQTWLVSLSTVNSHFHKACAMTLTHHPLPIRLGTSTNHIGSRYCLFQDTPTRLHSLDLVHIPTDRLGHWMERLIHLTVIFTREDWYYDNEHERPPAFIMVHASHLQHIIVEETEFGDLGSEFNMMVEEIRNNECKERDTFVCLASMTLTLGMAKIQRD
ncbi:hypothetical protein SAMD00019534_004730 [Acytostelium subglobosum LB1]|uniref:hypothetical protein n=1 Tax=Acytostelium subglobosum LB1 TaxID=1410327 RepID=UPI000644FDCF|nr:hypothetical protein SAMD00019534_004730 [Acytostelium subglobosum LB1]GAM17298.1 hypothetical protein SAMD00019534_004730 [Acytostelium subglobosum LB1]|eukprot:XP_012759360.1 hypothetical protein SAMD00019534_004730 [Acytostelium subglobosum LB1]